MQMIKQFLVFLIMVMMIVPAHSADLKYTIEPVYGIETSLVQHPEPARYVTRATYGARLLYGTTLLSGEAEVTEAKSRQDYSSPQVKVENTSQRGSLGLRSTIPFASFAGFYFRAGGRASQGESKITSSNGTETVNHPLRVDPYAGTGLQIAFASLFSLNAGVTLIRNSEGKYDSQYLLGLSMRFGNR